MGSDLISRQWMLDLYGDYIEGDAEEGKELFVPLEVVRQNIKDAPSAEKTGKWIDRSGGGAIRNPWWETHKCDQCGRYGCGAWTFCPSCGAKMVDEDESNS